jgi:dolichol-phosphate mannosyltransferase
MPETPLASPAPAERAVPAFTCERYRPKSAPYCACVLVLNEQGKLQKQLDRMAPLAGHADIIIADGGSTDGSTDRGELEPRGVTALLTKTGPGKLGAQMRMAFAWALDQGYRGVVTIDGNNKDGPEAIPAFVERLEEGYDHVQGSRFLLGGVSRNLPTSRLLGLKLIHAPMISRAAGFCYTDTTNGFRAYSARFLEDPRVAIFRNVFTDYELHYYLAIRAGRLGFRVTEVPVSRVYPDNGPVPTKISPIRGNLRVLRGLYKACRGDYDPQSP